MAVSENTLLLPKSRQALEDLIEAAIARLDNLEGDCDLEVTCEDEGAQCDDEGFEEVDCSNSEDDQQFGAAGGWTTPQHDSATVAACVSAVESLRAIQKRKRHTKLARPVRVLAGCLIRR